VPYQVAALFVETHGVYSGVPGVDLWDADRDALFYKGPYPVVAHPPCARWSVLAPVVEAKGGARRGDDGGTFAAALGAVRKWGGVLEHPASSAAWRAFDLPAPSKGGWQKGFCGGWSAHVEQVHYGHRARKATWLYAFGCELPSLRWGRGESEVWVTNAPRNGSGVHMSKQERKATPIAFRDILLGMARSVVRSQDEIGAMP